MSDEIYRLLVVRGYAQHEAHRIAYGPPYLDASSPEPAPAPEMVPACCYAGSCYYKSHPIPQSPPEPAGNAVEGKPPLCYVMRNKFDHNHVHQFMEHTWELLVVPSPPETKEDSHHE